MGGKYWQDQEIEFIKANYKNMTCEEMANHLHRTARSVQHQYNNLELQRYKLPKIGDKISDKLTVQDIFSKYNGRQNVTYVKCLCDCGKYTSQRLTAIKRGRIVSCGCHKAKQAGLRITKLSFKHGRGNHNNRLYRIWSAMHNRCRNKNSKSWINYGGRGIIVCPEWKLYEIFEKWALSNGYCNDLTIDRINTNGNYDPNNCRWITNQEQCNNKRNNVLVSAFGETKNITEWLNDPRCQAKTHLNITYRLSKGWNPEKAISVPPLMKNRCKGQPN